MASTHMSIPASKITENVHMTVTLSGMKSWRVRMWLASKLVALAGLIAGFSVDVNVETR